MGGQGLQLLMKLKFLIMLTRPQKFWKKKCFAALSSLLKILISSTALLWLPNLISHLFIPAFFSSWLLLFYTMVFWLRFHLFLGKIVLAKYLKAKCCQLNRILHIVASYILLQFKGNLMRNAATQMIVRHSISFTLIWKSFKPVHFQ